MAANDGKAIALKITTTAGVHTVNLRLEDATGVLVRNAVRVTRGNAEVPLTDLTPADVARHLATLWMNRVMKTEAACTFGIGPEKSVAIRPQTIVAISGEVISPSRAVGFGSIEHEAHDVL